MLANGSLDRTAAAWERFVAGADSRPRSPARNPHVLVSLPGGVRSQPVPGPGARRGGGKPAFDRARCGVRRARRCGRVRGRRGRQRLPCHSDRPRRARPGVLRRPASPAASAADSNLAPWYTWSEWASGTNGMGTALESHGPVIVAGPEHWCRAFHSWTCAGIAVRNVVTDEPLAALGISCWKSSLPGTALSWLRKAVATTEATLRERANHTGTLLAAAFGDSRLAPSTPLAAVDVAGNVVLANTEAAVLLGTPAETPAYAPADRWAPRLPALPQLVGQAMGCARQDPHWSGATQVFVPFLGAPVPVAVRPVFIGSQIIGALLAFGSPDSPDGDLPAEIPSSDAPLGSTGPNPVSRRVVALRQDRWVLLEPAEIRFAEVDHNNIWLMSDQGRLLAATRGLDRP